MKKLVNGHACVKLNCLVSHELLHASEMEPKCASLKEGVDLLTKEGDG